MKAQITSGILVLLALCLGPPGFAQTPAQDTQTVMQSELGKQVPDGCNAELVKYCPEVTPGQGRLLACLYAYQDKLSGQCEQALYTAARLERAVHAITYVANECRAEIQTHCATVQPGQGRIAQCLKTNADQLGEGCRNALAEVGG